MTDLPLVSDSQMHVARNAANEICYASHDIGSFARTFLALKNGWSWSVYRCRHAEQDFFDADYEMTDNMWQDYIIWFDEFDDVVIDNKTFYRVQGVQERTPVPGDTLMCEFPEYYFKFEFLEINFISEHDTIFYATVFPIDVRKKVFEQVAV